MRLFFLLLLIAASAAQAGDIIRWTDEHGNVHFADRPPSTTEGVAVKMQSANTVVNKHLDEIKTQGNSMGSWSARVEKDRKARAAVRRNNRRYSKTPGKNSSSSGSEAQSSLETDFIDRQRKQDAALRRLQNRNALERKSNEALAQGRRNQNFRY